MKCIPEYVYKLMMCFCFPKDQFYSKYHMASFLRILSSEHVKTIAANENNGKICITFMRLTTQWESNQQMGVDAHICMGAHPDKDNINKTLWHKTESSYNGL